MSAYVIDSNFPINSHHISTDAPAIQEQSLWDELFSIENIKKVFHEKIRNRSGPGVDRITASRFEAELDRHAGIISKKCISGTYKFSPYLEQLMIKRREVPPRLISIPTIRDKIVLSIMKDIMHIIFSDFVPRDLPNTIIRKIKMHAKNNSKLGIIRVDIKGFYDNINHEKLLDKVSLEHDSSPLLKLLRRAIENPTLPANYKASRRKTEKNRIGVPQGLPISNILAEIYLAKFDNDVRIECEFFNRFVDDILIFCRSGSCRRIWRAMKSILNDLSLEINKEKSTKSGRSTKLSEGIEFLGYSFSSQGVSVKLNSYQRYLNSIFGRITKYKFSSNEFENDDVLRKKNYFIHDINERITGAIDGRKRYGWIFFYSEITDFGLLHQIDRTIAEALMRVKGFTLEDRRKVKKVVRAHYEARHCPEAGYIHNYNIYESVEDKMKYLMFIGRLKADPDASYTAEQINAWFNEEKSKRLLKLERDVGMLS